MTSLRTITRLAAALCMSAALLSPLPVHAFSSNFANLFFVVDGRSDDSGKSRAAAQAQSQYGGKVLSVSESSSNGQVIYKVKLLLDSGRIKIVTIKE